MPAILDVDLTAIAANYKLLKQRHARQSIAAVVKADAYGLGMPAVAKRLWEEGCRDFCVATLGEAMTLRGLLPDANIAVFNGLLAGEEKSYINYRLIPVINDLGQVERLKNAGIENWKSGFFLHIDTGMTRLGLSESDLRIFISKSPLPKLESMILMSHLACGPDTAHPKNPEQLARFNAALKLFPGAKASLSNSSGLFISPDFHFDIARIGSALYGINPCRNKNNPLRPVAKLSAPLLQIRTLGGDETIGYDATFSARKGSRIAVAALGYADGWMRSLSNKGSAYIANHKVPIVGIISMDMLELDVSSVPENKLTPEIRAEFINDSQTVDDVARDCNTIGYEIFTRIGNRVERRYTNGV